MELCAPDTGAAPINYCLKRKASIKLLFQLFSTHYTPIQMDLVEKHLCNQGSHYEKYGQFPLCMQRKPSHATTISTLFAVSKDEWNTKDDTG